MSKRFYRPELDALRFFAFCAVVCDHLPIRHSWYYPIRDVGAFGVCLFFLLSAYLIVTILLREKENTGTVALRAFAMRRGLRIWPLYFAVLLAVYLMGRVWPIVGIPKHAALAFTFFVGNLYVGLHGWVRDTIDPLWSISVEEQFYLLVPLLARLSGSVALAAVCIATVLVSYGALVWLCHHGAVPQCDVWVNSFVQFQFFAAGGILALVLYGRKLRYSRGGRVAVLALGLGLWFLAAMRFGLHSFQPVGAARLIPGYLAVLAGTVLVFLSIFDIEVRLPGPLVYLGKISYGLYLFHRIWLTMIFGPWAGPLAHVVRSHELIGSLLALAATVLTAMLSYRYFENPILRFKHRFEVVRTRPD